MLILDAAVAMERPVLTPVVLEHMSKSSDTSGLQTVFDSVVAAGTVGALLAAVATIIIAKTGNCFGK